MISWFEKHTKISWLITILIIIAIFYISSISFKPSGISGFNLKPIFYHLLAFFCLAFFLSISLVKGEKNKLIILGIILAVFYGIFDETHQLFVPGRYFSISDILTDSAGVLFANVIYGFYFIKRNLTATQKPFE